jgi:hypothetical protein
MILETHRVLIDATWMLPPRASAREIELFSEQLAHRYDAFGERASQAHFSKGLNANLRPPETGSGPLSPDYLHTPF